MNNKEIDRQRYHDDLVAFSQKAFKATNFPYWYFIRVASVN